MNKNLTKVLVSLALFMGAVFLMPKAAHAATLQFDPTTLKCTVAGTCTINIVVDAGSEEILATDARITYDPALLEVSTITDGTYLTIGKKDSAKLGEIYIAGIVDDPAKTQTGSGTLASVTFKGKVNGTATLSYVCKPGETATDSNIAKNDLNATDIIQCSDNGTATVTVGSGATTTITPTNTNTTTTSTTSTTTSTTTPRTLPQTGVYDELIKFAIPGIILLFIGLGAKKLL